MAKKIELTQDQAEQLEHAQWLKLPFTQKFLKRLEEKNKLPSIPFSKMQDYAVATSCIYFYVKGVQGVIEFAQNFTSKPSDVTDSAPDYDFEKELKEAGFAEKEIRRMINEQTKRTEKP